MTLRRARNRAAWRHAAAAVIAAMAWACTPPETPPEPPRAQEDNGAPGDAGDDGVMAGDMTLRLFEPGAAADAGPREPIFTVEAPRFARGADGRWTFTGATATIRAPDGEDIVMEAARGELDQDAGHAWLTGGVTVRAGTTVLELADAEWDNETRTAWSNNPVRYIDGETRLEASAMEIRPDNDEIILENVSGFLNLGRFQAQ